MVSARIASLIGVRSFLVAALAAGADIVVIPVVIQIVVVVQVVVLGDLGAS
jgi:hypothetical protein